MNYLAHLYIAEVTETSFAGALLGDHVRGRLDGRYGRWVEDGIRLHRRVDTFTDGHPVVLGAFRRFAAPFRRYAGILIDIYFDHLLARHWPELHTQRLGQFAQEAANRIRTEWPDRPPFPVRRLTGLPDLLQSYQHPSGIADALAQVDQRLSRPSPLARAWPYLQSRADGLARDFHQFFPELLAFARGQTDNGSVTPSGNSTTS